MSTTQKIIAVLVYTLVIASSVYYLSPTKTIEVTKIETQVVIKEVQASKTHTKSVVQTNKDGSSTSVTETDNTTDTTTNASSETKSEVSKEVVRASNGPTIGALVGLDVTNPAGGYIFAGQISFPIPLLPVSIVLQGATNKTVMAGLTLRLP